MTILYAVLVVIGALAVAGMIVYFERRSERRMEETILFSLQKEAALARRIVLDGVNLQREDNNVKIDCSKWNNYCNTDCAAFNVEGGAAARWACCEEHRIGVLAEDKP